PMVYRGHSRGAMKVYATTAGAFGDAEQHVLGLLAEAAATLWGVAQPVDAPVRLSASLKAAMRSREVIGFAVGVLMAREHLDPEAARSLLLERARAQGRGVSRAATEIVQGAQGYERDQQQ